ncbi:MAG: hypothetical protein HYW51_00470, partial [Candidatus Doudnabacteria bacterium]|nr:hypothetical protein [Candidatus Doudnabacteria bacterium]
HATLVNTETSGVITDTTNPIELTATTNAGWTGYYLLAENASGTDRFSVDASGNVIVAGTLNAQATTVTTLDTGQGANELYDMDQNVLTTSTPQFARLGLGAAADATNILTVTSTSTTNLSKGINASHTGAITGTGYGGYFSKTGASTTNIGLYATASGATSNYAAIFEAGDVGIGTTAPGELLHIDKSTATTGPNIKIDSSLGDGSDYMGGLLYAIDTVVESAIKNKEHTANNYGLEFQTYSGSLSTKMTILGAGNVGIGVTDPAELLEVENGSATTGIQISNTATDGDPFLAFALSGTKTFTMGVDDGDSDKFKIGTTAIGTNTRLTIDSSGNVGIGTATPGGTLSVLSANATGTTTSSAFSLAVNSLTTGTGLYAASSTLTSGKLVDLQVSGTAAAASQTALNILTAGANGTVAITTYGAQISNTHTNATSGTNVALYLNASGATTANYGLIVNAGDVGIGTTGPSALLDVRGAVTVGAAAVNYAQFQVAGSFTSGGASTVAYSLFVDGTLTGASGDTTRLVGSRFDNEITTQTATESISQIAQVFISEPGITDNLTGDITTAASLIIADAPTEGQSNYALLVDAGDSRFDGSVILTNCQSACIVLQDGGTTDASIYTDVNNDLVIYDNTDIQAKIRNDASALNDDGWATGAVDYGEFMEKLDHNEEIKVYEVVGVKNNKITKNTNNATFVMVTSTDAGIRGGNPIVAGYSRDKDPNWVVVAYIGQVPVLVSGKVNEGDYILPSGNNDGKATAVSPEEITAKQFSQVIGRALESSTNPVYNSLATYQDPNDPEQDSELLRELAKLQARRGAAKVINVAVGLNLPEPEYGGFKSNYGSYQIETGDVVAYDEQGSLKRAGSSSSGIAGVVTEINQANQAKFFFQGRARVKVTQENGVIKPGDRLTLSKTLPGYAMKMTESGQSIGIALESLQGSTLKTGKILVFVNLSYQRIDIAVDGSSSKIVYDKDIDMSGFAILNVKAIASLSGKWSISEEGILVAREVRTDKLCLGETCVTESQLKALLGQQAQAATASGGVPSTPTVLGESTGGEGEPVVEETPTVVEEGEQGTPITEEAPVEEPAVAPQPEPAALPAPEPAPPPALEEPI